MRCTVLIKPLVIAAVLLLASNAYAWRLVWDASTGTVGGYLVEISDDSGASWKYVYNVAGDKTELNLDDKCAYGKLYSFRVSAWNVAGVSAPCPSISWQRPSYVPPQDAPLPAVSVGPIAAPPSGASVE